MKFYKATIAVFAAAIFLSAFSVIAQSDNFSDPAVDYTFGVPDTRWKMIIKPSATSPNVEYVYGDRSDGHLAVRKISVAKDAMLSDIIENEEQKLLIRPGFVAGKQENFAGHLRGAVYNFEYVAAGRSMSGRFYFLKGNDNTVYVLRFTGQKEILRTIRNQTDSIARTFAVKNV
ncbi:MAG: hypothetical protein ABR530_01005 [Pyrinomonadaceae bacterium]